VRRKVWATGLTGDGLPRPPPTLARGVEHAGRAGRRDAAASCHQQGDKPENQGDRIAEGNAVGGLEVASLLSKQTDSWPTDNDQRGYPAPQGDGDSLRPQPKASPNSRGHGPT